MEILNQIQKMAIEMKSNYNDGYTQLYYKNKLLLIKEELDRALKNAPTFQDEEKYIESYRNINTKETA